MASLIKDKAAPKRWRIQFMPLDGGKRAKTIRFSGHTKRQAESVFAHVAGIIQARRSNTRLDDRDADWLGGLPDVFLQKLVKHGLAEARVVEADEKPKLTLAEFMADYIQRGKTAKQQPAAENTLKKWRTTQDRLNEVFPDRMLDSFTLEDAQTFRDWLDSRRIKAKKSGNKRGQKMTENGIRKYISGAKLFFTAAKRRGLVTMNPFEEQVSAFSANRSRDFFVSIEATEALLQAAPDAEWRLLIALWRYAGLRKMEPMRLTWGDVLLDQNKIRVHSPKTAHHGEGHAARFTPSQDVAKYLRDVFDLQAEGKASLPAEARLITRYSTTNTNLDKPIAQIIEKAGLERWPKMFQNLRSSCETEWLDAGNDSRLVAKWMGHTVKVQAESYDQVRQEQFDGFKSVALSVAEDARNGQKTPESVALSVAKLNSENAGNASIQVSNAISRVAREGVEPSFPPYQGSVLNR